MCKSFNHNGLYSAPVNSILALCKNYEIFYVNTLVTSHSKPYTVKMPHPKVRHQTVDKALFLQGFAIVGTAFLI